MHTIMMAQKRQYPAKGILMRLQVQRIFVFLSGNVYQLVANRHKSVRVALVVVHVHVFDHHRATVITARMCTRTVH